MEAVQIEHLAAAASAVRANGNGLSGEGDDGVASTMNGQLEIEIPTGERQGAIHTIQLQSPGGSSHIVEGLVVTTAGGGGGPGDEGETTLFHPTSAGTFILPTTSNHHHNHLAQTSTIVTSSSPSCEVITADSSDQHILSGLQVVRVTTGENGETIFLVPSSATTTDKHGDMQQVMVLQSAEEITEEVQQQEMMDETAVELNIPSPKPVLTTVKQEVNSSSVTANSEDPLRHHYQPTTTLVVVTGNNSGVGGVPVPTSQPQQQQMLSEHKPIIAAENGRSSGGGGVAANNATKTTLPTPNGSVDNRPKRKAALKATALRRELGIGVPPTSSSSSSPSKKQNTQKSPRSKSGTKIEVTHLTPPKSQTLSIVSTTSHAPQFTQNTQPQPPPPPIVISAPPPVTRVMLPGGTQIQGSPGSYFLLPEDVVSESDDDDTNTPVRKCIVCLRRRRFTEDIFDGNNATPNNAPTKQQLLQHMDVLIAHLNISAKGKPSDVGICPTCLDSLQRWHVFNCAIVKRHEAARATGAPFDDSLLNCEPFETRVYRNFRKIAKVKEVYLSATHSHLSRRHITEKDWDFFCDNLFRFNSVKSERARELEKYITCREKLSHIYCIKCQRLVKNGKKGFMKHMKTQHPHESILFPCDICGNQFPDKDMTASSEEYYPHWISHFYFNTSPQQWNAKSQVAPCSNEDRPWKCDHCDASFKMKGALVSHRDVVHFNLKNHVCNICGEAFKSASSLRGHVRRHEGRRDYKCEVCHKEYYTYSALKGHKVVHQTARDFICGICGKAFKKKKALEEHGTLHTGVKPHRCPICGREIRVKSNLYKHMKIHKKNAELGITSGRGRSNVNNSNTTVQVTSIASASSGTPTKTPTQIQQPKTENKMEFKVKQIKVEEQSMIQVKEEPHETSPIVQHHFHQQGASSSVNVNHPHPNNNSTSSPIQGATAVDVVLENELGTGDHRGPIVVSIVTDGLSGGASNILEMDPEQQAQLLSAVTSLATSQGQTVTVSAHPGVHPTTSATFLASPHPQQLQSVSATTTTTTSSQQDPILGVSNTQFYNTQQFFTSLDQLQN
ncbi:B-cell lymphoma 6 protein [Orchesella cincta]|uniref:B-cell lymphoma 6 protein n=1 Tax=Orchesella cincta TaxID=48709 RepID=A0A1D2MHR5_ORCCI|nr:B-cell lymphoma 6 protein [Orchesella cincta]